MNHPLPKAIQAQVDRANQLAAEMTAKPNATESDAVTETPAPPANTTESQPAQETPVAAVTETQTPPKTEDWEHKYRVLQGMFKAEVSRQVNLAVGELRATNEQLRQTVETLKTVPQAPQTMNDTKVSLISPDEVTEYGADLLDIIDRKARESYLPIIEGLQAEVGQLKSQLTQGTQRMDSVEQVTVQSARERFFSAMDTTVPSWETLNNDPGFLSWLDSPDDLTGIVRRDVFNTAYGKLDALRVAKFFTAYAEANGMGQPAELPPANTLKPIVPLDQLQAPGKTRTAAPPQGKRTYSRQEISAFYRQVQQGRYKGREAEALQFEKDVALASAEGRIT